MNFTYEYFDKKHLVVVKITGNFRQKSTGENKKKIFQAFKELQFNKLLFDFREAVLSTDTITIYYRPKTLIKIGFERDKRYAYVYNQMNPNILFYETVLRNNGFNVYMFTDYDKALAWLESDKTELSA